MLNRKDKSQKQYKCSCQVYIQQFKFPITGYLYFVWIYGKDQIQSLKYQSRNNRPVQISETLNLNLKLKTKNGQYLTTKTSFFLLDQTGQEIDQIQLNVHQWTSSFKEVHIPIGGGAIRARVRRKQILQIDENNSQVQQVIQQSMQARYSGRGYRAQVQQAATIRATQRSIYQSRDRTNLSNPANMLNSLSIAQQDLYEQLSRIKKQLQDSIYLNNKLKNDRDVLMKKQMTLELELENVNNRMREQIRITQKDMEKKVLIREEVYQHEIQQLVQIINSNAQYTRRTVEQLLKRNIKAEEQLRNTQENIHKLQIKYQNQLKDLNYQVKQLLNLHQTSKDQQSKMLTEEIQKNKLMTQTMRLSVIKEKNDVEKELQVYKSQCEKSKIHNLSLAQVLNEQLKINQQKSQQILLRHQQIQKATQNVRSIQQKLQKYQSQILNLRQILQKMKQNQSTFTTQLSTLKTQIQQKDNTIKMLQQKLQEITYQLEFNQDVLKQHKVQQQEKEQQLYSQLENIQAIYNQKLQQFGHKLNIRIITLEHQNQELRLLIENERIINRELVIQKDVQIESLQNQLKSNVQNDKLIKENDKLMKQIEELTAQISSLSFQLQNRKLSSQGKSHQLFQRLQSLQSQVLFLTQQLSQKNLLITKLQTQLSKLSLVQINSKSKKFVQSQEEVEEVSLGPINPKEYQVQIKRKDDQIDKLTSRVEELYRICSSFQAKLNFIANKYPNIDIGDILHQIKRQVNVLHVCDSQKQQQNQINTNLNRKQSILDSLQMSYSKQINPIKLVQKKPNLHSHSLTSLPKKSQQTYPLKQHPQIQFKRKQSLGFSKQMSQHSNNSYIKVSHSQKIKELEGLLKEYQIRELDIVGQIQQFEQKLGITNQQNNNLTNQIKQQQKVNQTITTQLQNIKIQNLKHKQQIQTKNQSLLQLKHECHENKKQIQRLNHSNSLLSIQIDKVSKQHSQVKQQLLTSQLKLKQSLNKQQQIQSILSNRTLQLQSLSKTFTSLEIKHNELKNHQQQTRMQNRQLIFINQQTTNQMKKYKLSAQEFQEKYNKFTGLQTVVKDLNKQIQQINTKNLEQTRIINHYKLEKDTNDQEIKIIKKKHNEQTRLANQYEEKVLSLERTIDQIKRKQSKYKRQVEDAQQETRKVKSSIKKLQQELHTLHTLQTSFTYQKKKLMDQVAQKQDQLTRKQYQCNRLVKQVQKSRHRIQQTQQARMGRKSQLRIQIQKLQSQLIRRQKRLLQSQQQQKSLKSRLQFLEKQNSNIIQKKTQTYGDKLKHYIDQIISIKKMLDQYQQENTRLKLTIHQIQQDNQLIKTSFNKLQRKYQENILNQENILIDLQHYIDQNDHLKDTNRQIQNQIDRILQTTNQNKKQLQEQKIINRKKTQKLQNAQRTNGALMQQLKQLKIRFSQLQTQQKIGHNVNERYRNLDRKKCQLQQDLKRLKNQYQTHLSKFIYKQDDMQKAIFSLKSSQKKHYQQQLKSYMTQTQRNNNNRINKFQLELLGMFNQNSKLRDQIQAKAEEIAKSKLQFIQYQGLVKKNNMLQTLNKQFQQQITKAKDDIKKKNQRIFKDQLYLKQIDNQLQTKQMQLTDSLNKLNDSEMKVQKIQAKLSLSQQTVQSLQQRVHELLQKQNDLLQQKAQNVPQKQVSQTLNSMPLQRKIFELQLQVSKCHQKQLRITQSHSLKIKSLQQKLQQMSLTMNQHQSLLQKHYESQLYQNQQTILKLSQELQDKIQRIDQLNQAIITLQHQNQLLTQNNNTLKYKINQEMEIFNTEYNKLRNKLKESQQIYNQNVKSLQQQLNQLGKQLTNTKHKRQQGQVNSRIKVQQMTQTKRNIKRLQDKLKAKDTKLEQFKSNIYILQQTIQKLKKKQSSSQVINIQLQSLKTQYTKLQNEFNISKKAQIKQISNLDKIIRDLKKQVLNAKNSQEQAHIKLQEKLLEFNSNQSQLKTTKQLYADLQMQFNKRKTNISTQIQQTSSLISQLKNKQIKINNLITKNQQLNNVVQELKQQNKKISIQNKRINQSLEETKQMYENYKKQRATHDNEINSTKSQVPQLHQIIFRLESEIKQLKVQLGRSKKQNQQLQYQTSISYQSLLTLQQSNSTLTSQTKSLQSHLHQYYLLQSHISQHFSISLQQIIPLLQQKQKQIQSLVEEIQELRFLIDRKGMDYQQIRKDNYQLEIRVQDAEEQVEQVQGLRNLCDRLEEEKKRAVFNQELIKMQLTNIIQNNQNLQYKHKIQAILRSCNNMTVVSFGESSFGNY